MKDNEVKSSTAIDPAAYAAATTALRAEALRLLAAGAAAAVVGYRAGRRGSAQPFVATTPEQAAELIFTPACVNNLALYLTKAKKEVSRRGKLAIVAKGCDLRAIFGLIGESQFKREDVILLGVACAGVYRAGISGAPSLTEATLASKCKECTVHVPTGVDFLAGSLPEIPPMAAEEAAALARLEAMTRQERWAFWKEQFSRCVRCLACRQVCPFCFCEQCLCDRNRPQAVESTPRPAGNMSWHIVRAMHLAGRCAGCAECERVCPMDIPLNLLNRKMAQELKTLYGQEAGLEVQEKGPLTSYHEKDDESFIK
ncbi:MAG: Fe-S oxidoreductase [Desulfuromonadales bacterium GWD2_61_12]|nr:MAG: Fe-S oxidoreductase [Desulfuromonadales bacterium GWD2_61_12]HBT82763.1 Fe-S oxidoreductase [Desulfuromonas sp.]